MVAIDMEANTVKAHAGIDDLRVYREFTEDPMDKLAATLTDLKLERGKLGIEMEFLPAKDFATLQKDLPAVQWVAADAIFNKARQVKTPKELELLRALSKLTDKAIGDTLRQARAGMSEMDLAGLLLGSLFAGGAENYKLMIIASGERSQFPNVGPTERRLKAGDLIRMEIFGQKNGYLTGVCRTAVVGDATPEQYKIWSNLIECKYLVMDLIKPGASCPDIYRSFCTNSASWVSSPSVLSPTASACTCMKNLTWDDMAMKLCKPGWWERLSRWFIFPDDSECRTKTCFA